MLIFGSKSFNEDEQRREQERRTSERLHESKMALLKGVADSVKEQETGKDLPESDLMVRFLTESSAEKILRFKYKIEDYANEMERCTARIEARLARIAISDLDRGDYRSSRIKPYERFLKENI